ncbi:MAG: branched-chain amino acid ABC transporter permease [Betaproteobacteria bacterium]|nr:branched-chain amino acid ABC transporter permease [Rhodocyclaceae bacterium]MCG3186618.1 High-affinity branched-chain amino acid transport system permease protein LivH [Rhodocyclaceae bacterium]
MDIFLQQLVNGLTLGSIYALVALGYTMVYGIIQLINFAHGEVVMVGAMVALSAMNALAPLAWPAAAVLGVALVVALAACTAVGWGLERWAYRPLRGAPRLAPLITAIGMSIVLQYLALSIWGRDNLAFPQLFTPRVFELAGARITLLQCLIVGLSVALMAVVSLFVYRSRTGTAMRAAAENPEVAQLMGVDVDRVIALAFMIGAALAAVAGVMIGSYYGIAHYTIGFILGLKAFSAAVLGGIGNVAGAMLGGLLLGLTEALAAGYIGELTDLCRWGVLAPAERCAEAGHFVLFGSNYQDVFAFLVLIGVLVFRPSGLLGERVAERT